MNLANLNNTKLVFLGFLGTQERVRNICGKRAIGVGVTEVLLYFIIRQAVKIFSS